MSVQSYIVKIALAAAISLPLCGGMALAQADQTSPQIGNAKYQVTGIVNTDTAFVRSGAGDSFYWTMKLSKGSRVTVVGQKFGWLKIVPPEGSYSYVPKAYVERSGDGSVGRVTRPEAVVRAGSSDNTMKYAVQTTLNKGDEVQIIGQEDEYFKIKPPQGAYLYINQQYVDPEQAVNATTTPQNAPQAPAVTSTPGAPAGATPETTSTPSTQPAAAASVERFEKIDVKFVEASKLSLTEQPIDELLKEFEALRAAGGLTDTVTAAVDSRIQTLKLRADAVKELNQAKAEWIANQKKQQASEAERQEIMQRIKGNEVKYYIAVGELSTSSLQDGGQGLYRLTDPGTGHTVVYLRDKDQKLAADLGKFIGVDGTLTRGRAGIQILEPTQIEPVNADEVGKSVAAQMFPESMLPAAAATTAPAADPSAAQ